MDNRGIPSMYLHVLYRDVQWEDEYGFSLIRKETNSLLDAEVVSSELVGFEGQHTPVLDIDFPAALVASSTGGHFHLYIDKPMSWWRYKRLLKALGRAGILEKGYVKASIRRGHTSVRVPWVKKGN